MNDSFKNFVLKGVVRSIINIKITEKMKSVN